VRADLRSRSAVLALAALVAACSKSEPPPRAPVPVQVAAVEPAADTRGVRYTATIAPWAQVDVASKVNGYIAEIRRVKSADARMRDLQQGDPVSRGTVLARVRDTEYVDKVKKAQADLDKANASLEKASQDWRRARDLYATQSITAPDYDQAKREIETARAAVDGARAQLDEARLNLQYTALVAPLDGVVVSRKIEVGSLVGPGSVAFTLADLRLVKVVFGVPDTMLASVRPGAPLAVTTESLPGRVFEGKVTAVAPAADAKTRVFQVEITIDNARGELRDGMVAALQVGAGATPPAPAVPLAAIVGTGQAGGYGVFVVAGEDGGARARLRAVELGPVVGNRVTLLAGPATGERVIVNGTHVVRDGDAVRVVP
jgi:multidrug efflux system membrane fusion protein